MLPAELHHVIAIGASAGGMEEINAFFDHTPLDGVSYIIIQHLSPDFKSRMVELLAKHSKLEVKEAENGMTVLCNVVYLIPHNKFMTIHDRKLYLTDKENVKGPHLTINKFFNSLAADFGNKAIGIVLSGLGSDGTEGIKAIKKAGGMIIVRVPETTEFSSMPSNAIATGLVDFILEPEQMPDAIEDYVKHEGLLLSDSLEDDNYVATIINLIKEQSPLDFTDYKQTTILRRIKRRAAYNNFTKLDSYLDFLKANPEEVDVLAKDFLISVTSFFRDKEAFSFIQTNIIPAILKKLAPEEELKIWVTGCATGEEAYSLAILIAEQLTGDLNNTVVKIFATDIDTVALVNAGKGIYNLGIIKDVSSERLEKYFIKEEDSYKVTPEIRRMVIFAKHDLVKNPPYCNMHFISCRNLLIYMTPALQKKVFTMLLFGLKMEGYLFLGSSENPLSIIQNLEVVEKKWKIYKNLEAKRTVRFDSFSLPDIKHLASSTSREDIPLNSQSTLTEAVNSILVSESESLIVCIDENNNVVKTYGDTSRFLLQKNFNSNLAELLPKSLAMALNTLSSRAIKESKKVSLNGIDIKYGDKVISVNISVMPLFAKKGQKEVLMVTFTEEKAISKKHSHSHFDEKAEVNKYTVNLEEELKEMKDKLHAAYLQLDASNENMQSFNEELLSANEEMQSTNEEMQSVNEELHTINSEYQSKNKELIETNDDLNNYFRSNINGQLFVNNDLLLMKFSPGTVKQINLLPSDIGRPLSNISTNIKFETIIEDIKKVITDGSIFTKEIETNNGKWYQIMTMPYMQNVDNKNNGAIITFNDITELKSTQKELDKKNRRLQSVNADLDNFVYTASHDLLAPLGNIEGVIGLMDKLEVTDPEIITILEHINSSVKKFRSLINDISTVAKLESDMVIKEKVDIEEVISNIEWSLEDKIKASNAVIVKNLEVNHIVFSKKNFRSILFNLISNAVKFRGDDLPIINVSTRKKGDNLILTIQDNGLGISKEGLTKIFDLYGRLDNKVEGQGIGLYLARKIINAANGNILVESEPGKGTKFTIYLKLEDESILKEVLN